MGYLFNTAPYSIYTPQNFMWIAEYFKDDTGLTEFIKINDTIKKNDIKLVNKNTLAKFGLIGNGVRLYYEVIGGNIILYNKNFSFKYKNTTTNETYNFNMGNLIYNDFITYKQAVATMGIDNKILQSNVSGYYFGYKKQQMNFNNIILDFKIIVAITANKPIEFNIALTSNTQMSGYMQIYLNDILTYNKKMDFYNKNMTCKLSIPAASCV